MIPWNLKLVRYYDKSVMILEAHAQQDPSHFGGIYLCRQGNGLIEIRPEDYGELFKRFQDGL
jgi:hypothetical protein